MTTLLVDRGDDIEILEKEQQNWLQEVLIALGANKDIIGEPTLEAKTHLNELEIQVWKNFNNTIDIYKKDKLVAQWKLPQYKIIKEGQKMYYEIKINEWAQPFQLRRK
jgi:hypothetical protein